MSKFYNLKNATKLAKNKICVVILKGGRSIPQIDQIEKGE